VGNGNEPRKHLVVNLKGPNDYRWVVNIMSHTGAINYAQAVRMALWLANELIKLNVNPLSAPDYIKEYRKIQSKIDALIKNISEIQGELTKLIETLGNVPRGQQVININGETINIGTLADKIENITNMIKQLNESITVKQNVTIAVYSHERNEIKSTVMVLANIVNAVLSNTVFSVERGRWTEFDNELIMRRDAIEKLHKSIQKIVARLERQHNSPLEELIPRATPANRIWLEMLDDASDLINLMLEFVTVPPQLRDNDMRKALYEKMKQYINKYRAYALSEKA
jgi:uncharacterized protein Yka (UPF0111/DUF47 family)